MGGHSWYWSYSNDDVAHNYPGNESPHKLAYSYHQLTDGGERMLDSTGAMIP